MQNDSLIELLKQVEEQRCEGQHLEVKAAENGTPKLYETLSSFSNQADGGTILLGISEELGFKAVGVIDAQRLQHDVAEQCKEMTPEIHPVFETASVDGATVVAVHVDGLLMGSRPAYRTTAGISKGSYVRVGDQDQHMTQAELYEIESFRNGARSDVSVSAEAELEMLSDARTLDFVRRAQGDRPNLAHRASSEVLNLTGAVRQMRPTLAGMMSLCDYPQQVYPNLCITAAAVAGTSISQREGPERFLDSKRFEGPIDQMIEDAMAFVRRNSRMRVVIEGGRRADVPEYPENAVREIITNSLMHRDYGPYNNGTPVRIVLYSDRFECSNPGGLYGGQSVEDLGYTNIQTRNPTLVSMLEILGVAENRHSGIPVIRDEMAAAGLRPPVFVDQKGMFTVKLFNEPDAARPMAETGERSYDSVLDFCAIPRSRNEIAEHLGVTLVYAGNAFINPLVKAGKLLLTMPDKPRSKFQRFVAARRIDGAAPVPTNGAR